MEWCRSYCRWSASLGLKRANNKEARTVTVANHRCCNRCAMRWHHHELSTEGGAEHGAWNKAESHLWTMHSDARSTMRAYPSPSLPSLVRSYHLLDSHMGNSLLLSLGLLPTGMRGEVEEWSHQSEKKIDTTPLVNCLLRFRVEGRRGCVEKVGSRERTVTGC